MTPAVAFLSKLGYFVGDLRKEMKFKIFLLRLSLAVIMAFVGALVAKGGAPREIFASSGIFLMMAAVLAFGTFGFLLPDIVEFAGKAGVATLARQIAVNIPAAGVRPLKSVARLRFRRKKKNSKYENPLVVDTSSLIDGRLVDMARTGFIFGTLLVIPSVVGELHRLADSFDEMKRMRGRRGLDGLAELQKLTKSGEFLRSLKLEVLVSEPEDRAVDDKLVTLARKLGGKIVSVDFNLNKVAKIKGVAVLNINELANALKTVVLPQDRLRIKVSSVGREETQGVGYLDDGTMVVVEGGAGLKGRTVDVVVHKVLQTAAGKMIFGRFGKVTEGTKEP